MSFDRIWQFLFLLVLRYLTNLHSISGSFLVVQFNMELEEFAGYGLGFKVVARVPDDGFLVETVPYFDYFLALLHSSKVLLHDGGEYAGAGSVGAPHVQGAA